MITYQDLLAVGEEDNARINFVLSVIRTHKRSEEYKTAKIAQEYDKKQDVTIVNYQKLLYTISGEAVPDNYSANYKMSSSFFNRFTTQQNQFLLGNGISWEDNSTAAKLGEDFDTRLQELGKYALVDGVSFGFWNYDHLMPYRLTEYAPMYDEEDGAMKAGVRFWQIDKLKPLRATLYELDGYTDYIWDNDGGRILNPKRAYKLMVRSTPVDGEYIYDMENYPSFPIIPLWGNPAHQSELIGIRESIDAYDLIRSGFANDLDDASQIYWTIQNAGGMDDVDLAQFVKRMRTVKAAVIDDDGARAESHTLEVPYASREALLTRLRSDLYEDYMALDTKNIAGGSITATQIKAAYEPMNAKADMFEYCVLEFLDGLMYVAGVEDNPSFTRSMLVNTQEMVQSLLQSAQYLSEEYVTEKLLDLFGDSDKTQDVLEKMNEETLSRMPIGNVDEEESEEEPEREEV